MEVNGHISKTTSVILKKMESKVDRRIRILSELPLFLAIIVSLEYLFLSLPNVAFTPLLFAIYFANRSYKESTALVSLYIILEIVQWGFGVWVVPMWLGWLLWIVLVKQVKFIPVYIKGAIFAYLYGLIFMPFTVIVYGVNWWSYIVADFPFATTMAISNLLTLSLLFSRLSKFYGEYNS